jgi:hypothetical protein
MVFTFFLFFLVFVVFLYRAFISYLIDESRPCVRHTICAMNSYLKCLVCSKPAHQRCERCKLVYYCSMQCMRASWEQSKTSHRRICDVLTSPTTHENTRKVLLEHLDEKKSWFGPSLVHKLPDELLGIYFGTTYKLGEVAMAMELFMKPNLEWNVPTTPPKTLLLRKVMHIGKVAMRSMIRLQTQDCFRQQVYAERIVQIGNEMKQVTRHEDPGFIDWFFRCDMLSFPDHVRTELRNMWHMRPADPVWHTLKYQCGHTFATLDPYVHMSKYTEEGCPTVPCEGPVGCMAEVIRQPL